MKPLQTMTNGVVGTVASIGAYIGTTTVHDVNAYLQSACLFCGLMVSVVTLYRFMKFPPKQ